MSNQTLTTKSFLNAIFPDVNKGKDVYYQGSRQMTSSSRRYYEKELGAGIGPAPGFNEMFGYSEPLRRFIQREGFEPQANEIPNTMPSWMPGEDYYTDFKKGDPYIKVDQGFARLPGAGYAALHPELEDVDPEDYPDINKMAILADVAPYSREYNTRDFLPLPCLGTIEKHYRPRRIYPDISLYMNGLWPTRPGHDFPHWPRLRSRTQRTGLTPYKTAPHGLENCAKYCATGMGDVSVSIPGSWLGVRSQPFRNQQSPTPETGITNCFTLVLIPFPLL